MIRSTEMFHKTSDSLYFNGVQSIASEDLSKPLQDIEVLQNLARKDADRLGDVRGLAVLEVGPGHGFLFQELERRGAKVAGADLATHYLSKLDDGNRALYQIDVQNPTTFPQEILGRFDIVVIVDVLEHLTHPQDALFSIRGLLAEGGRIYLRVPANESLIIYSRVLGCPFELVHLRSYTKSVLRREVSSCGYRLTAGPRYAWQSDRQLRNFFCTDNYWNGIRGSLQTRVVEKNQATVTKRAGVLRRALTWLTNIVETCGNFLPNKYLKRFVRFALLPVTTPTEIWCQATVTSHFDTRTVGTNS